MREEGKKLNRLQIVAAAVIGLLGREGNKKTGEEENINMPEARKILSPLRVAILIISLLGLGGTTSPWWYNELFAGNDKPEQQKVESGAVYGSNPAPGEEIAEIDRSDIQNRQKQLEQEVADLKRDRRRKARDRERWRDRRSGDRERDRDAAENSRRRDLRPDAERSR